MKKLVKIILIALSFLFAAYLSLPNPRFPSPPTDSIQSSEPADTETSLRRAYFTNYSREEVMQHYHNQLTRSSFLDLPLPTYRLNYPPEEAQSIIRDQTRSTFLEEIVHPFRESVYINGFEPKVKKDAIFIEGREWEQKIIVRYVPSVIWIRLIVGTLMVLLIFLLSKEWIFSVNELKGSKKYG